MIKDVPLNFVDYIVMAAYMAGLLGMGFYYRKFAQTDLEHYFLGGRKFPGWMSGTSYATTSMNADVAPAYCGMTVITGVWIYWWYISRFGLALMIGGILFAVFWRKLKIFTSPEFYELRFSGAPGLAMRSWVSLRSAFIAVVAWTGAGLLGLAKVSEGLLGWSRWETFALVIPIILIYVVLSGYIGVVVSDIAQTIIIILSSLLLMGMVWADFGGPAGLFTALVDQFGNTVVNWKPPASHEMLGIIGIIAWTIGTAVGYGGDVAPMAGAMEGQRLLACKSSREASKMYVWTQIVLFFMLAVLTLPALGAMAKWPGLHTGAINKELAYGMLLGHYLPAGLLGLALVGMFASIMSTVDSNMNFGAQVFINDIYRRSINRNASVKHYMTVGKVVMFVIMAMAVVVATKAQNVIDISVFMLGLSSAELTANWGQWWWWRFNGAARLTASFGGPIIFLINKFFIFRYFIHAGQDTAYLVVLSSIGITFFAWVLVAFFTKPEPEAKLIDFYNRAKPMGWWGPIARKSQGTPFGSKPILAGFAIAVLGTVTISSAIIAFSAFYVSQLLIALSASSVAIVAGVLFKKMFGRYITQIIQKQEN
jgi:solute:Na+ symporter, SSS family